MKRMRVYLGHLGYTTPGIESGSFPINIGFLKAYADRHLGEAVDIHLFTHVERLLAALKDQPPDVLGLSNYIWNSMLSDTCMAFAKSCIPSVITIQGGPNYPIVEENVRIFWKARKGFLDFYLKGEGEESFRRFLEVILGGGSMECPEDFRGVPGLDFCEAGGEPWIGARAPRMTDLDRNLPSPVLSGTLDEFILNQPLLQTTRGCPYACKFCLESNAYYDRLHSFSLERVLGEIAYIRRKGNRHPLINISDSNFGVLEKDIRLIECLTQMKRDEGWPVRLYVATPKRLTAHFVDVVRASQGLVRIGMMLQSTNRETLAVIKRLAPAPKELDIFRSQVRDGAPDQSSETCLIIPMPAETFASYLEGMRTIIDDLGATEASVFTMVIFSGIEFEDPAFQARYGMLRKWRFSEAGFGTFSEISSCEVEEVCVATNTFSFEEYLHARLFFLFCTIFYFRRNFFHIRRWLGARGVSIFEWILYLFEHRGLANESVKAYFDDFDRMTRGELFDSPDAVREYYRAHEREFAERRIGFNVIQMAAGNLSDVYEAVVDFALECTRNMLNIEDANGGEELDDLVRLTRIIRLNHVSEEAVRQEIVGKFCHDVHRWSMEGFTRPLKDYRVEGGVCVRFRFTEQQQQDLLNSMGAYPCDDKALRAKFYARVPPETYTRTIAGPDL